MAKQSWNTYDSEKIIKEINDLIKENDNSIFNYEIKRCVTVGEPISIEIKVELFQDFKGKRIIV